MKILSKNKFEQFDGFIYNGIKPVFMLKISNGKEIKCTNDHKFMMAGNILKELKDIKIDDEFSTGLFVSDIIDLEYQEDVYDALNVANGNVFFVNGIIASNCNLLYIDEVAFVQNWDEFSASVLPVISSGKTSKLIFTSTPKGLNHFYEYVEGARKGINSFKLIFLNSLIGRFLILLFVEMSSLCWSIYVVCTKWTLLSSINILDYRTTKVQVLVKPYIEPTENCTFI